MNGSFLGNGEVTVIENTFGLNHGNLRPQEIVKPMNGTPAPVSLTASSLKMMAALFFLLGLLTSSPTCSWNFSPHGSPLLGRNMIKLHKPLPPG